MNVKATQALLLGGDPTPIHRQIFLLPPELIKVFLDIGKEYSFQTITATPVDKALTILPLARKVSALIASKGIQQTAQILGLHVPPEIVQEAEVFNQRLEAEINGVVTDYMLDRFHVILQLLFAEVGRLVEKKKISQNILEKLELLDTAFDLLLNDPERITESQPGISEIHAFFQKKYPKSRAIPLLDLLKTGVKEPWLFIPLLLQPVHAQPFTMPIGRDLAYVDEKVKSWLYEFLAAWRQQSNHFFSQNAFESFEKAQKKFFDRGGHLIDGLINLLIRLHQYERLFPSKRWENREEIIALEQACTQLFAQFSEWQDNYINQIAQPLQDHLKGNSDQFFTLVFHSFSRFQSLFHFSLQSLRCSCWDEIKFNTVIDEILDQRFRKMGDVTIVDLLQLQARELFLENPQNLPLHRNVELIFMKMRSFYMHEKHRTRRKVEDLQEYAEQNGRAVTLGEMSAALPPSKIVQFYQKLGSCLEISLYKERWPRLLQASPFADPVFTAKNEEEFYFALFSNMRKTVLAFTVEASTKFVADNLAIFMKAVERVKKKEPSLDNFKAEARFFFATLSQAHATIETNIQNHSLDFPDDPSIQEIQLILDPLLSPGKTLMAFLTRCELQEETKSSKKIEKEEHISSASPPQMKDEEPSIPQEEVAPSPPNLFEVCHALQSYCQGFKMVDPVGQNYLQKQQEHHANILALLPSLRELLMHPLPRPFAIAATYLKVAVLLEQSVKLAAAIRHLPIPTLEFPHANYEQFGRNSLWDHHAPHHFAQYLINAGAPLNSNQMALLKRMERTIAISSRYPVSGRDELLEQLEGQQFPLDLLQLGMETSLALLTWALPGIVSEPQTLPQIPIWSVSKKPQMDIQPHLNKLERIQSARMFLGKQSVPLLSDLEETLQARVGTISIALKDLKINLQLFQDAWNCQAPHLFLTISQEIYTRQAVILERLFLIVLAHLKCPSTTNLNQHFLMERVGKRLKRDSHALIEFAELLPKALKAADIELEDAFYKNTLKWATRLEPMLKVLYRYDDPNESEMKGILTKLKRLSDEGHKSMPTALDQIVKTPALDLLALADAWLTIYEKLLQRLL